MYCLSFISFCLALTYCGTPSYHLSSACSYRRLSMFANRRCERPVTSFKSVYILEHTQILVTFPQHSHIRSSLLHIHILICLNVFTPPSPPLSQTSLKELQSWTELGFSNIRVHLHLLRGLALLSSNCPLPKILIRDYYPVFVELGHSYEATDLNHRTP